MSKNNLDILTQDWILYVVSQDKIKQFKSIARPLQW